MINRMAWVEDLFEIAFEPYTHSYALTNLASPKGLRCPTANSRIAAPLINRIRQQT